MDILILLFALLNLMIVVGLLIVGRIALAIIMMLLLLLFIAIGFTEIAREEESK